MDKQMIEEMAKIICKDGANNGDCDECGFHRKCSKFKVSEKIYNAGYRKIPENAVVILDEEMENFAEKLAQSPQMQKVMQGLIKAWEKETAEKFAGKAKEAIINMKWARDDTHIKLVTQGDCLKAIDEICQEIKGEQ